MRKNLFVTQNAVINRETKALKITIDDNSNKVPIGVIEDVFLMGNSIKLTNGARGLLLENNRNIFFYTSSYKLQGVLSSTKMQSNYRNRLLQYEASKDVLKIAQHIVVQKIMQIEKVFDVKMPKQKSNAYETKTVSELLGVEGIASSVMFKVFKTYLEAIKITDFKKREYRPTKDKVNGILSFAYTLYSNLLYGLVLAEGFDPYIGFLHKKRGSHYAFVSDLIEYDRAKLTKFVLKLFAQIFDDSDFDGIYLNQEGRKKFLVNFNEFVAENFENSKTNLNDLGEQLV